MGTSGTGYIDLAGCAHVAPDLAAEQARFEVGEGDILVGLTGYVGSVGRLAPGQGPCMFNQRVGRFVDLDEDRTSWAYLYCFLRLQSTKDAWKRLATGSAQANISASKILSVPMPLPDRTVQAQVVESVGALHQKAEVNRRMNDTLEELSQALMPELLGGWNG